MKTIKTLLALVVALSITSCGVDTTCLDPTTPQGKIAEEAYVEYVELQGKIAESEKKIDKLLIDAKKSVNNQPLFESTVSLIEAMITQVEGWVSLSALLKKKANCDCMFNEAKK